MTQPSNISVLADSQRLNVQREEATEALLCSKSKKATGLYDHLLNAKLHAIVQRDDLQLLIGAMDEMRDQYGAERVAEELWYFALLEGKPRTFEVLCRLFQEKVFKFAMTKALDGMPDAFQLWALDIPLARNLWLSKTDPLSARTGYKLVNGLRFLDDNQAVKDLFKVLSHKSDAFHARMRLFITDFGMQTLMQNGAFLHTISYYQTPSKKHLRVAATGTQPVYDVARMEVHWPGIGNMFLALTGLGLPSVECEERMRKIISNKHATAEKKVNSMELPLGFAMGCGVPVLQV